MAGYEPPREGEKKLSVAEKSNEGQFVAMVVYRPSEPREGGGGVGGVRRVLRLIAAKKGKKGVIGRNGYGCVSLTGEIKSHEGDPKGPRGISGGEGIFEKKGENA